MCGLNLVQQEWANQFRCFLEHYRYFQTISLQFPISNGTCQAVEHLHNLNHRLTNNGFNLTKPLLLLPSVASESGSFFICFTSLLLWKSNALKLSTYIP